MILPRPLWSQATTAVTRSLESVQHRNDVGAHPLLIKVRRRMPRCLAKWADPKEALKVAIHRLRKRYRELFRREIADTVADPAEVESELRYLAAALTRR